MYRSPDADAATRSSAPRSHAASKAYVPTLISPIAARRRVRVGLLDDGRGAAVAAAHDAPVPGRIRQARRDERDRRVADRLLAQDGAVQVRGLHRRVAHGDEDGGHVARDRGQPDADRVGGSALRLLAHRGGAIGDVCVHGVGAVAGDDHRTIDAGRVEGVEDVVDQGATGERMQHLRDAGAHAGSLAGGQDDGRWGGQLCRHVARW